MQLTHSTEAIEEKPPRRDKRVAWSGYDHTHLRGGSRYLKELGWMRCRIHRWLYLMHCFSVSLVRRTAVWTLRIVNAHTRMHAEHEWVGDCEQNTYNRIDKSLFTCISILVNMICLHNSYTYSISSEYCSLRCTWAVFGQFFGILRFDGGFLTRCNLIGGNLPSSHSVRFFLVLQFVKDEKRWKKYVSIR